MMRFNHAAWEQVTLRCYERLIQVGALLGAESVGSSAGAVMRDRPSDKEAGIQRYLARMKGLMHIAHDHGLKAMTIEPMSCLAEPPTLPEEIRSMAESLLDYHRQHPGSTVPVGYCVDVTHGYADRAEQVVWDSQALFEAALPYLDHVHLKNTDRIFHSTFGFAPDERARGIIDVPHFRDLLVEHAGVLPVRHVIGYLEITGPKTGRDYSDWKLERALRESLRYLVSVFR
jgi:ribulose-phosphate 3-epimerase